MLYKYLDRFGLDAVANLELKITPPNEFNDPFEFTPRLSDSELEWIASHARYQLSEHEKGNNSPMNLEEFRRSSWKPNNDRRIREIFLRAASKSIAVLCLSENNASVTQWAHYANGHTGLVLELRMEETPFAALSDECDRWKFCKVAYTERTSAEVYCALDSDDLAIGRIIDVTAREKSADWHLEQEYRLYCYRVQDEIGAKGLTQRLVNNRLMYFLKITASSIKRIILGERSSDEFEREVRKAAASKGINADQITRARLNHQDYTVLVD